MNIAAIAITLTACAGAVACGTSSPAEEPGSPPAPAAGRPAPAREVRCYAGPSQAYLLPANQAVGEGTMVARRDTDPARSVITEEVVTAFPGQPVRRFVVTMTVTGSRFEMSEKSGAFTGRGELVGPAWSWREWTSVSTLPDGTVVTASDRVTADGFAAEKTVRSADGVDRIRLVEKVTAFDCAEFEQRVAAIDRK